ncbi:MAG: serine/threonine-protein kinase [Pirellulales bacterium]
MLTAFISIETMLNTCISKVEDFFHVVEKSSLLRPELLQAWRERDDLPSDARMVATEMVKEGHLTLFQGNQLLLGKHRGFMLSGYVIQNLLSERNKDAVYLAQHPVMKRRVAIKVIKLNESHCVSTRERFRREARISAMFNHPNIVKVYDFNEEDNLQFLIMQYVEGQTLNHLIQQSGPLHYVIAVEYIRQAADGLQHAHEKGIIHRNINPANLILDNSGTVKILDLGHSRFTNNQIMNITQLHQPDSSASNSYYNAPELVAGEEYDTRCDIYSLGATLFTLLAGRLPFQDNSYQNMLAKLNDELPPLSAYQDNLPTGLDSVVGKMMATKPENRFQSVKEVIAALSPILQPKNRQQVIIGIHPTVATDPKVGLDLKSKASGLECEKSIPKDDRSGLYGRMVTNVLLTICVGAVLLLGLLIYYNL